MRIDAGTANARRRYWARSYLGYPPLRNAEPNDTHNTLARLQHAGYVRHLITQNVDRLHHVAWERVANGEPSILELHGVYCMRALTQAVSLRCTA